MALTCCVIFILLFGCSYPYNNKVGSTEKSWLLLGQNEKIVLLDTNSLKSQDILIEKNSAVVALSYYYNERMIFFSESLKRNDRKAEKRLSRVNVHTGQIETVIDRDLMAPDGIAVDWIGKKIYWTDFEQERIEVAELDGRNRKVLFWKLERPKSIVVDPTRGYMYWAEWSQKAGIQKAGMNGEGRRKIVDVNLRWPSGLTLDYDNLRLFWVESSIRAISSCDLEGGDIRIHYNAPRNNRISFFSMAFLRPNIYMTDWDTYNVYAIEENNITVKIIRKELGRRNKHLHRGMDIKGYDPSLQPSYPKRHPCEINNGNCSHLCLIKPTKPYFSCACPTGISFNNATKQCFDWPRKLLILAIENSLHSISLDEKDFTLQTMPIKTIKPIVVDYDPVDKMVYWADSSKKLKNIQRAKLDGKNQQEIIGIDVRYPDGLAVDWIGRNLYWTDTIANRIIISRLDGSSLRVLLWKDLDEPRAIVVDPIHGYLFWSDWGVEPKIERSLLDGSNRTVIESRKDFVFWPNGLAVDYEQQHLYFSDARLDNIQRCNLDGSNRTTIARKFSPHIFGFSLLGDTLYWTDWQSRAVGSIRKNGLNQASVLKEKSGLMGLKAVNRNSWLRAPNNPCSRNHGDCSHLCFFFPHPRPHRLCACPIGYELLTDGVTCYKPQAYIIYSQKDDLRRLSISNYKVNDPLDTLPLPGISKAGPIAFDFESNRLFWIDLEKNGIFQALLNGSHRSYAVEQGVQRPKCLAVDWFHQNLYYGYAKPIARIEMVSISPVHKSNSINSPEWDRSKKKRVIIYNGLNDPTALAVDPMGGWIFWADSMRNLKVKVERASLDGSRREHLFTHAGSISDMVLDFTTRQERLIWINKHSIMSSDLRGENQFQIFSRPGWRLTGLDVYRDYIYVTESTTKTIYRIRKMGGPSYGLTALHTGTEPPSDLIIFVKDRQPHSCVCCEGECHHFCLRRPPRSSMNMGSVTQCGCATHYTLYSDERTCHKPDAYVIAITLEDQVIRYVPKTQSGPKDMILSLPGIENVRSFVIDPEERFMFYIDSKTEAIKRFVMANGKVTELVPNQPMTINDPKSNRMSSFKETRGRKADGGSTHVLAPYELTYDPINQYLYWTDSLNNVINVTSTKGEVKGVIVNLGSRSPRSMTIDPIRGHIYWASYDVNRTNPRIERSELDGREHRVIINENLGSPQNLLVHGHYLYWTDSKTAQLERWDINTDSRKVLLHGQPSTLGNPTGLVVLDGFLYWYSQGMLLHIFADSAANAIVETFNLRDYANVVDLAAVGQSSTFKKSEVAKLSSSAKELCDCSFFCVPQPNFMENNKKSFRCGCPLGLVLDKNKRECIPSPTCGEKEFLCYDPPRCIPKSWHCDGTSDCGDSAVDEVNCLICNEPSKYECRDQSCILRSKRCDGQKDCDSDEECCSPHQFQCNNKMRTCLNISKRCNGFPDCQGGSDEVDCIDKRSDLGTLMDGDASSRTTYTVTVVIAVLAVVLTCGIAGYTCTRRRQMQNVNSPYVMHTDQLDIMLVPNGPLFSGTGSMNDSDGRTGGSSLSRLGPSGSTGCPSTAPSLLPPGNGVATFSGTAPGGPVMMGASGTYDSTTKSKRQGSTRSFKASDVISFYERDRLTGASRSDTEAPDAPDYVCPLNPPPSPITDVGTRGRTRGQKNSRSRKRRHRSGGAAGGGGTSRHHHHHRRYHNVRLVIYTDAPPPTPRTCLSSAEEAGGPGSNSPQSSRRSYAYRPFPPPPSPENGSD